LPVRAIVVGGANAVQSAQVHEHQNSGGGNHNCDLCLHGHRIYSSLEEKLFPELYANIISALMPVSCSLLRAKMTVGNWPARIMACRTAILGRRSDKRTYLLALAQPVGVIFLPPQKGELCGFGWRDFNWY
jgi:hypothetical protein